MESAILRFKAHAGGKPWAPLEAEAMRGGPFDLTGKSAIVTGGSKGLGKAMAIALAAAGANVCVVSRNISELEKVRLEIKSIGRDSIAVQVDVTKLADIKAMISSVASKFGKIDVLVNNAGMNIHKPCLEYTEEEWDEIVGTNLKGVFLCSQAAAKEMIKNGGGKIINISSIIGARGLPLMGPYAAAKGGVIQLTKVMALEWAQYKINVNAIAPGYFDTELGQLIKVDKERYKATINRTPLGRWGKPEELAGLAIYMASDAAAFITGETIFIDGGYMAG